MYNHNLLYWKTDSQKYNSRATSLMVNLDDDEVTESFNVETTSSKKQNNNKTISNKKNQIPFVLYLGRKHGAKL